MSAALGILDKRGISIFHIVSEVLPVKAWKFYGAFFPERYKYSQ